MRKTLEVLRLKYNTGIAERAIATACGIARSTVQEVIKRHREAKLPWPLPPELDEAALRHQESP